MITFDTKSINTLAKLLATKKKISILTHVNPDGDAIGSSLGLFHFLKKLNHDVRVITPNDYPEFLHWLPGNSEVISYYKKAAEANELLKKSALIFALDFNHTDRLDKIEPIFKELDTYTILIDHHPDPQQFANLIFSETQVSSTAELVYLVIQQLKKEDLVTLDAATCLYTGIMTDTGCFNYNCSYPATFQSAGKLIEKGIDTDKISINVYDNYSAERMQLMGYCLYEKMKIYPEYKTAIISLTKDELKKYKHNPGDTEGFVNLPLSIKGMVFSIFLMEKNDHVKLSLRSKGNFAANHFAVEHFDGGGHFNAAGGQCKANMDETIKTIEKLLSQYKNELINAL